MSTEKLLQANSSGNVLTVADLNGTTTYEYDDLYRVLTENRSGVQGQADYLVESACDAKGNRTRVVYPNGRTLDSHYDRMDRLTKVEEYDGTATTHTYDHNGNRIRKEVDEDGDEIIDALGELQDDLKPLVRGVRLLVSARQ